MARPVYRFGEFRVDPVARELWRGDQLVALPPHVFDCLAYLIARHDRAVGRDELVAAVWGRTEVSDTLLGQTVLRIRRELGDDGKDPHVLRTIPRFGYRWVAPLRMAEEDADAAIAAPASAPEPAEAVELDDPPAPAPPPRRTRPLARPALAAVLAALVAVVAVALVQRGRHSAPPGTLPAAPAETAAVMPAAVEPGAEWAWMRLGVMDVVATRLRGSGLPTVPSENVIALLNAPPAHRAGSLREAAAFRLQVSPRVGRRGDAWEVSLDADDGAGRRFSAQARARDATEAAREAADRLLVALGRSSPPRKGEPAPQSELLQRIDAAILADDPDTARSLIEQAAVDRHSPELQLRLAKIDFRAGHVDAAQKRLEDCSPTPRRRPRRCCARASSTGSARSPSAAIVRSRPNRPSRRPVPCSPDRPNRNSSARPISAAPARRPCSGDSRTPRPTMRAHASRSARRTMRAR